MTNKKLKKQVNVRLNEFLIKRLKYIAVEKNITFQDLVEELLIEGLTVQEFKRCRKDEFEFPLDYEVIKAGFETL